MNRKILLRTLLLSVTTLGLISCLGKDENIQPSQPSSVKLDTTKNTQQGLTVAVDPVTGKFRAPTREEQQTLQFQEHQLQKTTGSGSTALKETVLADGTVMIDLKGQFHHQIEVKVVPNCIQDNKNKGCSKEPPMTKND